MKQHQRGFTLIELLLYVGIAGSLLLAISIFLSFFLSAQAKQKTILEVDTQGRSVLQRITQTIRDADAINTPSQGSSGTSLSLGMASSTLNPTVFDVSGNVLRVTEGVGSPAPLTSNNVQISNIVFHNLSRSNTPGTVRFEFRVDHINPADRNEFNYHNVFYGSASLR